MIYVYSSSYDKVSYGVRVLHTLAALLNGRSPDQARVVCFEPYSQEREAKLPLRYKGLVLYENHNFGADDVNDDDIVVYPDIVKGNPLGAKRVVRYLLNRPYYLLDQGIDYGQADYLLAYSKTVDSSLPQLFLLNDDRAVFCPDPEVEKLDQVAVYFGKINKSLLLSRVREIDRILGSYKRVVVLNRLFPTTRLELVSILRQSKLLLCLDPLTSLSYESTLCGTPSLVFDDSFSTSAGGFGLPLFGVMTEVGQWDEAVREVSLAYQTYVKALDSQEPEVFRAFREIEAHFHEIESKSGDLYRERNRLLVSVQAELDQKRAQLNMRSLQLTSVFRMKDIPKKLRAVILSKVSSDGRKVLIEEETRRFPVEPLWRRLRGAFFSSLIRSIKKFVSKVT